MSRQPRLAYLVADGGRAQLILRHSRGAYEILQTFACEGARGRPGADSRPRVFSASGAGRTALEPDAQTVADRRRSRFAVELAAALCAGVDRGRFEAFTLVAPPRMLHPIREALSPQVRAFLSREVPCDLTRLPKAELHERLDAMALVGGLAHSIQEPAA